MNDDPNYREIDIMALSELINLQRRILRRIKHLKEVEGLPPDCASGEARIAALPGPDREDG
jgi:hypothetical protein